MNAKFFTLLALLVTLPWFSGCVSTVDGRREAGMPWVKDKVEGRNERTPLDIWAAAIDVIKYHGVLTSEDRLRSTLQGNIDTRSVWVFVEDVDTKVSKVTVQARTSGGGTDVEMASFIKEQIAVRLATGNLTPATPTSRAK